MILMFQDLASALQHAMPFLDPPAPTIPADAFEGLLERAHLHRRQEQPLQRLGPLGRMLLHEINGPEFDRRKVARLRPVGRAERYLFVNRISTRASRACKAGRPGTEGRERCSHWRGTEIATLLAKGAAANSAKSLQIGRAPRWGRGAICGVAW